MYLCSLQLRAYLNLMKTYNILVEILLVKLFALKNFKINIHQDVSRAFNILHYSIMVTRGGQLCAAFSSAVAALHFRQCSGSARYTFK